MQTNISKITLRNFRSIEFLSLKIKENLVVIKGDNASGKSNFLMALATLANANNNFTDIILNHKIIENNYNYDTPCSKFSPYSKNNEDIMEISVCVKNIDRNNMEKEDVIGLRYQKNTENNEMLKKIFLNNKNLPSKNSILSIYRTLWLVPKMNQMFTDGPSHRRKFFDKIVIEIYPQFKQLLRQLENLNRQRLIVIASRNETWLKTLEDQIACVGTSIASMRLDVIDLINSQKSDVDFINMSKNHSRFIPIFICTWYCPVMDMFKNGVSALEIECKYAEILKKNRNCDLSALSTKFGAHKMDLGILDNIGRKASECSMGEQRILLISLIIVIAIMIKNYTCVSPILLLDEFLSHFDDTSVKYIIEIIKTIPCQSFITLLPNQLDGRLNVTSGVQFVNLVKNQGKTVVC